MIEAKTPRIDKALVRMLQQTHAEAIHQAYATGGEGRTVIIRGTARAFLSGKNDYKNRIVLTGNEPFDVVDALIDAYAKNKVRCHVEVNPANFKPDDPPAGRLSLSAYLAQKGFSPWFFRSVWMTDVREAVPVLPRRVVLRSFGPDALDAYVRALRVVLEKPDEEAEAYARTTHDRLAWEEGSASWRHFVAYVDDVPAAVATLFCTGEVGLLGLHPAYVSSVRAAWASHPATPSCGGVEGLRAGLCYHQLRQSKRPRPPAMRLPARVQLCDVCARMANRG